MKMAGEIGEVWGYDIYYVVWVPVLQALGWSLPASKLRLGKDEGALETRGVSKFVEVCIQNNYGLYVI